MALNSITQLASYFKHYNKIKDKNIENKEQNNFIRQVIDAVSDVPNIKKTLLINNLTSDFYLTDVNTIYIVLSATNPYKIYLPESTVGARIILVNRSGKALTYIAPNNTNFSVIGNSFSDSGSYILNVYGTGIKSGNTAPSWI
jgi:hypothetical protein